MWSTQYTECPEKLRNVLSQTLAVPNGTRGVEPGRTPPTRLSRKVRMLLSFQRPSRPVGKGIPSKGRSPEDRSPRTEVLRSGSRSLALLGRGVESGSDPVFPCPAEGKYTHSPEPR